MNPGVKWMQMNTRNTRTLSFFFALLLVLTPGSVAFAGGSPAIDFTKVFTPDTIGPGSTTRLVFTLLNNSGPAADIEFTDNLPAGVTIATPASATTDCGPAAILSAPNGGTSISLTDGSLPPGASCTVSVNVTTSAAPTPGVPVTYMNVSEILTSSVGVGGPATDDLVVIAENPGVTKSFSPSTISPGQTSTLTITIDNSANASGVASVGILDNLPAGLVIATPNNASTDCGNPALPPTFDTVSGTSLINFFANGLLPTFPALAAGATCTIVVDVIAANGGTYHNVSNSLALGATPVGFATATLNVPLDFLNKSFVDDPVPPGGIVNLEFTINNFDRNFEATGITFSDDLDATLSGLVALGLPMDDVCGEGSQLTGTGLLTLTGGNLGPEEFCTFTVPLQVPAMAATGDYPNTTTAISATVNSSPIVGNMASDALSVVPFPVVTKTFTDDPVNPGESVVLDITVTNSSPTADATDISFTDVFANILPTTSMAPPAECCGTGSSCVFTPLFNPSPPCSPCDGIPARLTVTGGNLLAGESCNISITLDVAADAKPGLYPNVIDDLVGTVEGVERQGKAASDDLVVIAAPTLSKSFIDDPMGPGGTVTLEFMLELSPNAPGPATNITFTDDLEATLTGLTANLPSTPDPPCGVGSSLVGSVGDSFLTFAGATLQPGDSCSFSVTVDIPAGAAPDNYLNTTSGVSAMMTGLPVSAAPAQDTLNVTGLRFTKEFLSNPVFPDEDITLRFTLENVHPTDDATISFFTDSLATALGGLAATGPATFDDCGGMLSGTTFLIYSGGGVLSGETCTIDVPVKVPVSAPDGTFINVTSSLTATQSGGPVVIDPATDALVVDSRRISVLKEFLDDPVAPGDPVTLEFTLTNLDSSLSATSVGFTDDLDAALTGLIFDSVGTDTCGGTVTGQASTLITVSDVTLAPSASCTIQASLTVPGGADPGLYLNTSSAVTGTMNGFAVNGPPATDTLDVFQTLDFSKAFDGPSVAGGTAILTFTITNPGTDSATGIGFSDNLNDVISGMMATNLPDFPCGEGSSIMGSSVINFVGGELGPMATCMFDVEVTIPPGASPGTYNNVTSQLFQLGLVVSEPATADLEIEPPPEFDKTFVPDAIAVGGVSNLVFTIDNSDSAVAADNLTFTDNLPSGLLVATPSNASTTCTGGTITAASGTDLISYSGGSVAAGAACVVEVNVVASGSGTFHNTSGNLTSSSGNSGTASDSLFVDPPPGFHKSFSPNSIAIDGVSTLTFTINNSSAVSNATGLDFTDNLPTEIVIATPSNATTDCTGGTLTAADGTGVITYTGGTVDAGSTCTVSVDVTSSTVGSHQNVSGDLTSSLGNSGTANATLRVNPPPGFTKAFSPDPSIIGGVVTLTFTIDNTESTSTANNLDFLDTLPGSLLVNDPANVMNTSCGGTITANPGTANISLASGSVSSGSICSISVDVVSSAAGMFENVSGDLTSSLGNSGPATATLVVNPPPVFSKAFVPAALPVGDVGTLVFSINNTGSTADAIDLDFTDVLPSEIVIADPANETTDCDGGIITAVAGTDTIAYTGGIVPAKTSCTLSVDITSDILGMHDNLTGDLTSSLGNSGPADATLEVNDPEPPTVTSVTAAEGPLEDCSNIRSLISNIGVTITDTRTEIVGADDPANYQLIEAGADGDFSTTACGGAMGDDVAVGILGVEVTGMDPLIANASVQVATPDGLAPGIYRFFVCDTITDAVGNPLDGDGDMTAGTDFQVPFFRADPGNRLINGHFDDCPTATLDPWTPNANPPNAVVLGAVGTDDGIGSPRSTSVQLMQSAADPTSIEQCVEVEGDAIYDFECRLRYEPPMGALAIFQKICEYFDATACTGNSLGTAEVTSLLEDNGGVWSFSESIVRTPVDAVSALCSYEVGPLGSDSLFDLYMDDLFFGAGDQGSIFEDGFESGDTSAWSGTQP